MKDLRVLPKLRDSWSYLYVEHCKIDREDKAIAIHNKFGKIPVPCATLSLLMLGPGTSITHAAIQSMADCGCLVIWCGEQGVRFYAQGMGESRSSKGLLKQIEFYSNPEMRLRTSIKMYQMRFTEDLPDDITLQQIRGREGVRVREKYAYASRETGVEWKGRSYSRGKWSKADPVNRALSSANSCLYGVCHAAIVSLGYSTALGFIHTGKQLSFVYDIADLYKTDISIPIAFSVAASGRKPLERYVRIKCREEFAARNLLAQIVSDIEEIFSTEDKGKKRINGDYDGDAALPGSIWDPEKGSVDGGVNYSSSIEDDSDGSIDS